MLEDILSVNSIVEDLMNSGGSFEILEKLNSCSSEEEKELFLEAMRHHPNIWHLLNDVPLFHDLIHWGQLQVPPPRDFLLLFTRDKIDSLVEILIQVDRNKDIFSSLCLTLYAVISEHSNIQKEIYFYRPESDTEIPYIVFNGINFTPLEDSADSSVSGFYSFSNFLEGRI